LNKKIIEQLSELALAEEYKHRILGIEEEWKKL